MAAYDPLEADVVENILGLRVLRDVVAKIAPNPVPCGRRAWALLDSSEARMRVARIVQLARLTQPEWLFRDVWDFVADLALGGDDESDPPSSAWFWRVFYGETNLSTAICWLQIRSISRYHLWKVVSITAIGVRTDWGWLMICALCNCLGKIEMVNRIGVHG